MRIRSFIKVLAKILNIYSFLKKIEERCKLYFGLGHGHSLLLKTLRKNKKLLVENSLCLEIGSSREKIYDQGSSEILGKFFSKYKIYFLTIDADKRNTERLNEFAKNNKFFNAICSKGEEFSKEFQSQINFLYLDAFDIYVKNHSRERLDFYKNIIGKKINDYNSAEMHLTVIKNFKENFSENCIIVFDDTFEYQRNIYKGKGMLAIPYLLENNFTIIGKNKNSIALKKN